MQVLQGRWEENGCGDMCVGPCYGWRNWRESGEEGEKSAAKRLVQLNTVIVKCNCRSYCIEELAGLLLGVSTNVSLVSL